MSLAVDVTLRLGSFRLDAAFEAAAGVTALFGRSGSGKTSLVNAIAGLVRPQAGRIAVDGRVLFDAAGRIDLPAHRRKVGYVFQEGRLFPHLTVRQNLLYGRWFTPRTDRQGDLAEVVALLGIGDLLARRPAGLSGGEKQRVAIGRALLADPRILLMDEPLASLDAERKAEILPFIERLRDELRLPIVYVSHSLDEVARLADTVVLIGAGRVIAVGSVGEVLTRLDLPDLRGPHDVGGVLTVRVAGHDPGFALTYLDHPAGRLVLPGLALEVGAVARVQVLARDVSLALRRPEGLSIRNLLRGRVAQIAAVTPAIVHVRLDLAGEPILARITRQAAVELRLAPGSEVWALVKTIAIDRGEGPVAES